MNVGECFNDFVDMFTTFHYHFDPKIGPIQRLQRSLGQETTTAWVEKKLARKRLGGSINKY